MLTTSAQLETAQSRGRRARVANRRDGPRASEQPPAREAAPPERKPAARPPAGASAHEAAARGSRGRKGRRAPPPALPGLPPPPAPRRRARPTRPPGPEPQRAALTHLSFSVPKMEAKYSAISQPPPPPPLPTPPTLPDARGRRHPDATTLAPPRRRVGAAQSDEALSACGRGLPRTREAPPPRPGSPRAARWRPLPAPALSAQSPRSPSAREPALSAASAPRAGSGPRSGPRSLPLPGPGTRAHRRRSGRRRPRAVSGAPVRVGGFR